jgi:hypothetical protein
MVTLALNSYVPSVVYSVGSSELDAVAEPAPHAAYASPLPFTIEHCHAKEETAAELGMVEWKSKVGLELDE